MVDTALAYNNVRYAASAFGGGAVLSCRCGCLSTVRRWRMAELPSGTVTFLFTDIEGSTRLWEQHPDAMRQSLVRHDALVETCIGHHGGVVVRPRGEGDSRFAVFASATAAILAAVALQQALQTEAWPPTTA